MKYSVFSALLFVSAGSLLAETDAQAPGQTAIPPGPLRWQAKGFDVKLGIESGAQIVGEWNSWWNLAEIFRAQTVVES